MTLHELVFSDLCVAEDWRGCWYKKTPDALDVVPTPDELADELIALRDALKKTRKTSFMHTWSYAGSPSFTLRIELMATLTGEVYICRRFMLKANVLSDLGFAPALCKQLLAPSFRDGLIIFCGKAGSGKTTAAYTFFRERLTAHGGILWTLENPPEMMLSGRHNKGICYQIDMSSDEEFGAFTPKFLRATPNYVLYGEIRDAPMLRQAIKLALSGHLIAATIHAGDLVSCITRLGEFLGNEANLLAEALRAVIHLELYPLTAIPQDQLNGVQPTGDPPRVLGVSPLIVDSSEPELKAILRDKAYHMLQSAIERKRRQYLNAVRP